MLVKILGLVDVLVAIVFFVLALNIRVSAVLIIILVVILAVKSLPFVLSLCVGSIIDIIAGILLLFSIFFSIGAVFYIIAALLIAQKGVMSLL